MKPTEPTAERQALYERMAPLHQTPLWEVLHALVLVLQQPAVRTQPMRWRWAEAPHFIEASGRATTAEEAVRRALILENRAGKASLVPPARCMAGCS